jgi:hypothetical protein
MATRSIALDHCGHTPLSAPSRMGLANQAVSARSQPAIEGIPMQVLKFLAHSLKIPASRKA